MRVVREVPGRLLLMTTRHIAPGEECLIDYHSERGSREFSAQEARATPGLVPCICLSPFYRGMTR